MDPATHRRMRTAHTRQAHYCTCGKVVWGNGGKWAHADMHVRRDEWRTTGGFAYVTERAYDKLFPAAASSLAETRETE